MWVETSAVVVYGCRCVCVCEGTDSDRVTACEVNEETVRLAQNVTLADGGVPVSTCHTHDRGTD